MFIRKAFGSGKMREMYFRRWIAVITINYNNSFFLQQLLSQLDFDKFVVYYNMQILHHDFNHANPWSLVPVHVGFRFMRTEKVMSREA